MISGVSGKLQEIHRNERCEEVSSREWEQIHEKSASKPNVKYYKQQTSYPCNISYMQK